MPNVVRDVDGREEERFGTVSVFNGPEPIIAAHADAKTEIKAVAQWISHTVAEDTDLSEIGIFVRTRNEIDRARAAILEAGREVSFLAYS